jgi:hypothetical protein
VAGGGGGAGVASASGLEGISFSFSFSFSIMISALLKFYVRKLRQINKPMEDQIRSKLPAAIVATINAILRFGAQPPPCMTVSAGSELQHLKK